MKFRTLTELCAAPDYLAVTAHRGASWEYPENTLLSMEKAVESGADFIEFDLRASSDNIPLLLHDSVIDRTSNGTGAPETHSLSELKQYNFSFFRHGERSSEPFCSVLEIPTFEEVLKEFRGRVFMNIQIYLPNQESLREACRLYGKYDMYDQGYMTIADPKVVEKVHSYDPEIAICLTPGWHERALPEKLELCRKTGCRFVQPTAESVTSDTFRICRELGLRSNVFYADEPAEFVRLIKLGTNGIMTNRAEVLCAWRRENNTAGGVAGGAV